MNKITLVFIIITIFIVIGGVVLLGNGKSDEDNTLASNTTPTIHQYFWSLTCPHCINVSEFIETWEGRDIFEMEKFEVNESRENSILFLERGTRTCKIPSRQLGVPLLVTPEGDCYSGDVPIIDYLKSIEL